MKDLDNNSQGIVSIIHGLCLIIHKLGTGQSVNYSPRRHGGQGIIHNIKGRIISIHQWELSVKRANYQAWRHLRTTLKNLRLTYKVRPYTIVCVLYVNCELLNYSFQEKEGL